MRLLCLIFACYFAFLACLSCADEVPVRPHQTHPTVTAAAHADCTTGALGDWCSPLCQCHCCGGAVVAQVPPAALTAAPPVDWGQAVRHGVLVVAVATRPLGAVWQPPQA